MIEIFGDIFEQTDADAICFTSNGVVQKNGELVMGAGIAKAFRDKFPGSAFYFGQFVSKVGNKLYAMDHPTNENEKPLIVSFPTKNHFKDKSDLNLIVDSAKRLVGLANHANLKKIYLVRPGCGLGGLNWEKEVKPAIKDILDDRFVIVEK